MLRLRRYRVFLVFAVIAIILLFHVSKNTQWERLQSIGYGGLHPHPAPAQPTKPESGPGHHHNSDPPAQQRPPKKPSQKKPPQSPPGASSRPNPGDEAVVNIPKLKSTDETKAGAYGLPTTAPTTTRKPQSTTSLLVDEKETTTPASVPDDKPSTGHHDGKKPEGEEEEGGPHYADWPPRPTDSSVPASSSTPHWKKPYEFHPVPEEQMIMLPTGKPKPIPKVQYDFGEEPPAAKEKRQIRLDKIKAETKRAWTGYKQFAWTHDEVRPISKVPNDPFCGWAATLVDALDTLWIMGMKDEFDDAVEAVKLIDFSTTPYRSDIPVFETIIRYLGGLVGAYDVTGGHDGKYRVLLEKAEELAAILMGVFDTPNRMPILYYRWKPENNEKPQRASSNSGVAELATMSLEFTRLAQLTGKNKYYDAIARITDALEDLQNRPGGTAIPGIFPQNLDASGCNRTAATQRRAKEAAEIARKVAEEQAKEEELRKQEAARKQAEEDGSHRYTEAKAPTHNHHDDEKLETDSDGDGKNDLAFDVEPHSDGSGSSSLNGVSSLGKRDLPTFFTAPGHDEDADCEPMGLTSPGFGSDSYSMGGSQDSAYEYFPKQYLLLGGLVPKYQTMHEKTVEAIRNYLLFRPQAKGDPDVLFSAKALSPDGTDQALSYEYEVTHLTCFLGGMFGLGGKIFERPEDVEIGKRLAAGCAWAYEVMPTGIMPEYSHLMPCASVTECHFNETAWGEKVDPYMSERARQMEVYNVEMAEWKQKVAELKRKAAQHEAEQKRKMEESKLAGDEEVKRETDEEARKAAEKGDDRSRRPVNNTMPDEGQARTNDGGSRSQLFDHELNGKATVPASRVQRRDAPVKVGSPSDDNVKKVEGALDFNAAPTQSKDVKEPHQSVAGETQQKPVGQIFLPPAPSKPLTHEEVLANQHLFPGFTALVDRRYILR